MRRREWVRGSENVRTKSSEGTSQQPYEKRHVDGMGVTWSSSLPQGEVHDLTAQGVASRRRQRCRQHETLHASPGEGAKGVASMRRWGHRHGKLLAVSPPRYPQVGKTVEGDEIEEAKTSH